MGVEYRHFLAVDDAAWLPQPDTMARVEAVLRAWTLVGRVRKVVDLRSGIKVAFEEPVPVVAPGPGKAVFYDGVEGAAVGRLLGPPNADDVNTEPYLQATTLVVGTDIRVQWSPDGVWFKMTRPPMLGAVPVAETNPEFSEALFAASFEAPDGATPPVVEALVEDHARQSLAWTACCGFWRGAVVLDFGKSLPPFVDTVHRLPNRQFVNAIAAAFRAPLVEIGELY